MRRKEGFTLIELLAVIVILSIIALIAVPIVLGIVERVEKSSYKESLRSLFKATDLYIASTEFNEFPDDGINVIDENIKLKNKNFVSGKIVKNESGNIELDRVSNGKYCGSGPLDNIVIIEGGCDQLDDTPPTITIGSGLVTSSRVTIVANGEDLESGISGYQFSKDNGSTWTSIQVSNVYTFTNLVKTTSYTFKVRVYNNNGLPTISNSLEVTTQDISLPTYSVDVTGWSQSKVVTINYPDRQPGYVYEYSLDGATTWIEVESPATTQDITFTENGTVIARISDGANEISGAVYDVTNIDKVAPIITVNQASLIIELGSVYNDAGITATDDMLGNITGDIVITGSVDTSLEGTYTLTYNVSDEAGNAAEEKTRTIYVVKANVITFTSSQTWTVPADVTSVEVLVVGGGGAGGSCFGGGGGAGGVIHETNYAVTPNTDINVVVGAGGIGNNTGKGGNGGNSFFGSLTALGGGGGGSYNPSTGANTEGLDGGSGGGASTSEETQHPTYGGSPVSGQGYKGGNSFTRTPYIAAGGGGAGGPGQDAVGTKAGDGGIGYLSSITGTPTYYAGGGGGAAYTYANNSVIGYGGEGGGADGVGGNTQVGNNATPNTGGGGGGAGYPNSTGGDGGSGIVIIKYLSKEKVVEFTSSQTWTVPADVTSVEVLVVGGGGAGGSCFGGGGGAGGVIYETNYAVTSNTDINIVVGTGGIGNNTGKGGNGGNSSFGSLTALGGGGGGSYNPGTGANTEGLDGGSGGGASTSEETQHPTYGGSPVSGQGYKGGNSFTRTPYIAAGGGGAGGPGQDAVGTKAGDGGIGYLSSITGTPIYYAGGGGGAAYTYANDSVIGYGGEGGGADGVGGNAQVGNNATPNTGGGGGGAGYPNSTGGDGGSGIVIIRYLPQ